ncbi:MAG: hypothetical protein ACLFRU_03190 [Paracoccaceae bacterium]
MSDISPVMAYATWLLAPVMAWQALSAGLERRGRGLALFFALYSALVFATAAALTGAPAPSPLSVLIPWAGVAVLSGALYALGRRTGGRQ